MAKKFVVALKDIKNKDKTIIEKNDVGIIVNKSEDSSIVFFIRVGKEIEISNNEFDLFDIHKTGDAFQKKVCNVCHKLLDTTYFDKNQNAKNNRPVRRPSCKKCRKIIDGVNANTRQKREWERNKPEEEPFECPICGKRTIAGITSKLVLDHDHETGDIRGWICDSCNTGLGRFKDDIEILKRAIDFLESE